MKESFRMTNNMALVYLLARTAQFIEESGRITGNMGLVSRLSLMENGILAISETA